MNERSIPRVLSIAGTDPTGGAGIQADLKSIAANGGYGMAVVTALVAQNTRGVRETHVPPTAFLRAQLDAVSDDVEIDAVKIGMLGTAQIADAVGEWLGRVRPPIVVLDPVMVATSGDRLLDADAEDAMRRLLPAVDLVTPNLPELAVLVGEPVARTWAAAIAQGRQLSLSAGVTVLVKGGHLAGGESPDALIDGHDSFDVTSARIDTVNTHGTGCSLSSALATLQARHGDWQRSLVEAKRWLGGALEHSGELEVGRGNGPIHHFHELWAAARPLATGGAPFSETLWRETAGVRARIDRLPFVRGLGDGTLEKAAFSFYLAQDAVYLREYSRALARASQLAPTPEEQIFWAEGARNSIAVEAELHRVWLGRNPVETAPAPVTRAYVDHLLATAGRGSYAVLVAALLPCYWIYADVGERLHELRHDAHPYDDWLATYADEAFAEATKKAIAFTDRAAEDVGPEERHRMLDAFRISAGYEHDFFEAGSAPPLR